LGTSRQNTIAPLRTVNTAETGLKQLATLWGCRGTLPAVGSEFVRYGGQTSCVEVRNVNALAATYDPSETSGIICDAGTGIIHLGDAALARGQKIFHILLSHMHYDHIMGLTRFAPLFCSDTQVHFYGLAKEGHSLRELISKFFSSPFFPIEMKNLPSFAYLHFHELNGLGGVIVNDSKVQIQELNHPQQALGFRIFSPDGSSSVSYITDHEHGTRTDDALVSFVHQTDLFLFDTTYSQEVYEAKHVGWGHSSATKGALFAQNAQVAAYGLFHHDPDASDTFLEQVMLPEAQKIFSGSFLCREKESFDVKNIRDGGLDKARLEGDFLSFCQKTKTTKSA
jgi:phosphoribosyl 1,2-cyclic phosphodiesterase